MTSVTDTQAGYSLIDRLIHSFGQAAKYQHGEVAPPVAILWTDADGQWKPVLPVLFPRIPQLLVLGPYGSSKRTGPAIWLKAVIADALEECRLPEGTIPILYLPEVSRQSLRAGDECSLLFQPLVEMLYRGAVWMQKNGKDWTVEAFLVSEEGLGLEVARDAKTRNAMLGSLAVLGETPVAQLKGRRLEAEDFDKLLVGDPVRDLLQWMNDPARMRSAWDGKRWSAFRSRCREQYRFDPETDGETVAGEHLGLCKDPGWPAIWGRFAEAPTLYPGIPELLKRSKPSTLIFNRENWPDANEDDEKRLRQAFLDLEGKPSGDARTRILELEKEHGLRRKWVWARMGQSTLAQAMAPLAELASATASPLGGDTPEEMARIYSEGAFRADDAALRALASAKSSGDRRAVQAAVRSIYLPWCEAAAERFQTVVEKLPLPGKTGSEPIVVGTGECILFADGLRFDLAQRLVVILESRGFKVSRKRRWAALPSVTSAAKPAVSPVSGALAGKSLPDDFTPSIIATEQPLTTERFRKLMAESGYAYFGSDDTGAPGESGARGWTEVGQIDARGHEIQIELAYHIEEELTRIDERVVELLDGGWRTVRIVTDHGWLLVPGDLPKHDLPAYLVASRWSRCAAIKGDSKVAVPTASWHWNQTQVFATAPGVSCFFAGQQYAHGGLSLQECLVADLVVTQAVGAEGTSAKIAEVKWRGLRCQVTVEPASKVSKVDLRSKVNDSASSLAASPKVSDSTGRASLVVEDEDLAGTAAFVVVVDEVGKVTAKVQTVVGGADE